MRRHSLVVVVVVVVAAAAAVVVVVPKENHTSLPRGNYYKTELLTARFPYSLAAEVHNHLQLFSVVFMS